MYKGFLLKKNHSVFYMWINRIEKYIKYLMLKLLLEYQKDFQEILMSNKAFDLVEIKNLKRKQQNKMKMHKMLLPLKVEFFLFV